MNVWKNAGSQHRTSEDLAQAAGDQGGSFGDFLRFELQFPIVAGIQHSYAGLQNRSFELC